MRPLGIPNTEDTLRISSNRASKGSQGISSNSTWRMLGPGTPRVPKKEIIVLPRASKKVMMGIPRDSKREMTGTPEIPRKGFQPPWAKLGFPLLFRKIKGWLQSCCHTLPPGISRDS